MEKETIRLVQVPPEFRAHSRNEVYVCHHLCSKGADGTPVLDEEICVYSFRSDRLGDDYKDVVLCLDCVKAFLRKDCAYEIAPGPSQDVSIEETHLSRVVFHK